MKTTSVIGFALLSLGLAGSLEGPWLPAIEKAQDAEDAGDVAGPLSEMARLTGAWVANGEGFSSTLRYEWALCNVLFRARNELRNEGGEIIGQYEGYYAWDPDQSQIVFWTVGRDGELHRGTARWRDGKLWHEATVSGGRIKGYRSALGLQDGELVYRANYSASASDEDVDETVPLVYRKQDQN